MTRLRYWSLNSGDGFLTRRSGRDLGPFQGVVRDPEGSPEPEVRRGDGWTKVVEVPGLVGIVTSPGVPGSEVRLESWSGCERQDQ